MLDIYGNTKTVEFVDAPRIDNGNFLLNNQITLNNGQRFVEKKEEVG